MDRIKKLKIKKQDGTFSDYIPIGADAENIDTTDGESVQLKLNKKPYYYDNVADIKADNKLKAGDMAVTLGYYEANDGGGGLYLIKNDSSLTSDNGSIHDLNNGLKAELIIDKYVYIKQFGAKGDGETDDTETIQNAIDYCNINNYTAYFGKGQYYISESLNFYTERKIILNAECTIVSDKDIDMIIMPWGSMLQGGIIKNSHEQYSKSLIILESSNYLVDDYNGYIKDITLIGTNSTGCSGIRTKYLAGKSGISFFTFSNIFVKSVGYALKITNDEGINSSAYFTGNIIDNFRTFICTNNIYINLPRAVSGNSFKNIQIQPPDAAHYNSALYLDCGQYLEASYNIIDIMVWDSPGGTVPFQLGQNTSNNTIFSYAYDESDSRIEDLGKNNIFLNGRQMKNYIQSKEKYSYIDLSSLSKNIAYPVIFSNLIDCVIDLTNVNSQSIYARLEIVPSQYGHRKPCYKAMISGYHNETKKNLIKIINNMESKYTIVYLTGGFKYNFINYLCGTDNRNNFLPTPPEIIVDSFTDTNNVVYEPINLTEEILNIPNGYYYGINPINLDQNSVSK